MSGGLGKPSVLDEMVWTLASAALMLHWQTFPRGINCKEDEYIVGVSHLHMAIYMW